MKKDVPCNTGLSHARAPSPTPGSDTEQVHLIDIISAIQGDRCPSQNDLLPHEGIRAGDTRTSRVALIALQ